MLNSVFSLIFCDFPERQTVSNMGSILKGKNLLLREYM